jgi:hypothetical protein
MRSNGDHLLVPVGDAVIDLRSHESIVRTAKLAGLPDDRVPLLCHLAEEEARLDAECNRWRDVGETAKLRDTLAANLNVLHQIVDVCRGHRCH